MTAFRILGVTMSPLHCRNEEFNELICENGTISAYTIKYADASFRISGLPPSHTGSFPLMESPIRHKSPDTSRATNNP